jgi:hypothetical protein
VYDPEAIMELYVAQSVDDLIGQILLVEDQVGDEVFFADGLLRFAAHTVTLLGVAQQFDDAPGEALRLPGSALRN